jgi:methionyl-tRNA formyltransferase
MRLVFMGTPGFAVPSLSAVVDAGHEVAVVVTRPDRPRRHGAARPEPSAVKAESLRLGIPVLQPEGVREAAFLKELQGVAPEVIVVVAYGQILPAAILDLPPLGCINVHASLLPRWRGAAPVARAIMAGDTRTGVTTMQMDPGLDTGPILLARDCDIGPLETAGQLAARLAEMGAHLLEETLAGVGRAEIVARAQAGHLATLAPPLRHVDGDISWEETAGVISCRVRGCNPWPVASAGLKGERVQILKAAPETSEAPASAAAWPVPGLVLESAAGRLIVACGAGTRLSILELRLPGRRAVSALDAVNGRMVRAGDLLTSPPG